MSEDMNEEKTLFVRDVMKEGFDLVEGVATVRQALETMKHVETKCLIVNKRHENDEYGIVVIADIARGVLVKDRSADRVSIYEVMTKPAVTVPPNMSIKHASALFGRLGLSRAPVVDRDGNIIGVVSYTDIVMKGMVNIL
ncbi:MAG: CBS domain-containing protein [Mariprofundaceae bacterium]